MRRGCWQLSSGFQWRVKQRGAPHSATRSCPLCGAFITKDKGDDNGLWICWRCGWRN